MTYELLYYYFKDKFLHNYYIERLRKSNEKKIFYVNRELKSCININKEISDFIDNNKELCVARFGASELFAASMFEFNVKIKQKKSLDQLCKWSGFFPNETLYGDLFNKCLKESLKKVDILGVWGQRFEEYYITKYKSELLSLSYLYNIEPWSCPENPWTKSLAGKRVLVIHPFENTIKSQYQNRDKLFPGTEILPEFELLTIKAVQTVAGTKDNRFKNWFEALEYMYKEASKQVFDIAIIGCGAYGMPLAAKLKQEHRQVIHLGGATQLLFGIRGKRWDEEADKEYIRRFYNDYWVYPGETEKPKGAEEVENGCYWK